MSCGPTGPRESAPALWAEWSRHRRVRLRQENNAHHLRYLRLIEPEAGGEASRIRTERRKVPERMRRVLAHQDRGCRFPGCGRTMFVQVHHIRHWAEGGRTTLDNLVTLCHAHHRLIHEGGWRIGGHPAGDLTFHDPTGRPLARASPGVAA